jgi:LPPG:FO 2-phospho-L-lactate transferase
MKVTALAGGVGGAKLVKGLSQILPDCDFSVIVNTGDDFEHYGLRICPDIDSIVYSLADLADALQGYGRDNDSYNCFNTLLEFDEKPWFRLGDKDLALQLKRTSLIRGGKLLSEATYIICNSMGISVNILPMTDDEVFTTIKTKDFGELTFQEYFVQHRFGPVIEKINYTNSQMARLQPSASAALNNADLIVVCPSNPWLSIFPILSVGNVEKMLMTKKVVAVSPIIGGKAIKGPAAKIFGELGQKPSASGVAELYKQWLGGIVIDNIDIDDRKLIESLGIKVAVTDIMMRDDSDKRRVAEKVIEFAESVI